MTIPNFLPMEQFPLATQEAIASCRLLIFPFLVSFVFQGTFSASLETIFFQGILSLPRENKLVPLKKK